MNSQSFSFSNGKIWERRRISDQIPNQSQLDYSHNYNHSTLLDVKRMRVVVNIVVNFGLELASEVEYM